MYSEPADGCNGVARMNGEPAVFFDLQSLQAYFMNSNSLLIMHVHHGVMSCIQNRALHVHLLDITKQRCCIEWFVSGLYNYVHFIT